MFNLTSIISDFKQFIARGNVIDLSVGIIMGNAFGRIVQSLVEDIIMPLVVLVMGGGADFSGYFLPLSSNINTSVISEARKQGAVFAYGNFISVFVNFFILASVVFFLIKFVSTLTNKKFSSKSSEVQLLTEIRDLLKNR
ncbi:MAG: large conductance mechanosensitive channel protein MscL [Candidatus Liberibacter europaeus]|uniref:Large-conductance mechanosensitive channel n=1 Tax=Candidatus Liberibacter europaeus TaxID=744859 RepID=A0A2T4VXN0_9HYPH|nr:large conductance mechanosensitive channel protein MscL [Candidatus Liberibacter europaeus]PTL86521.1 MAG: large conductance mechanosensitive channel protein MscL [Candidatus Liberibacter europaeus]